MRAYITEILLKKRDLLTEMLTLTESAKFYGDKEEADTYSELIEKRQKNIEKIKILDSKLEEEPYKAFLKNPTKQFKDSVDLIQFSTREIAAKIIELDKKNAKIIDRINKDIKKELKSFKEKQNMNNLYNNDTIQNNKNYLV